MPTAKAILYTRYQSKDKTFPIVIRLIDGPKKQKLHPTGFKVLEKDWEDGQVKKKHPESEIINSLIDTELMKAKRYFADCKLKGIPVDLSLAFQEVKSHSFTGYLNHRAKQYLDRDSPEMNLKVSRFAKELEDCFGGEVYFSQVTTDTLRQFDNYLIKIPNSANTRAKKFQFLRGFFQNAINEGKATAPNPFDLYKIPQTKPRREKLTVEELKAIEDLQLKPGAVNDARNMFLTAYYIKGIRFQNVLTIKWSDIKGGRLYYQSIKKGPYMSAEIHPKLKAILDFYKKEGEFVFPYVKHWPDTKVEQRKIIGPRNVIVNRDLKTVAQLAGITKHLSMHIARHTLAFHMKQKNTSIHVIKDALGQADTRITERYLQSLDDSVVDEALRDIYG